MNGTLKDKITNIAAVVSAIGTAILGLPYALAQIDPNLVFTLPPVVNVVAGILVGLGVVVTQVLTGKTSDGKAKTE